MPRNSPFLPHSGPYGSQFKPDPSHRFEARSTSLLGIDNSWWETGKKGRLVQQRRGTKTYRMDFIRSYAGPLLKVGRVLMRRPMETEMRIYSLCVMFLISILLHGCAVSLNQHGERVAFIDDKERNNCNFLTIVTGSNSLGYSTAHDAEGALNEVRNKAEQIGGNAVKLIDIDSTSMSATAIAEALWCEFRE